MGGMQLSNGVVCDIKDVFAKGTNYLIIGVVTIAIVGIALPIFFSPKNL
jgi:hypothetical protein